MSSLLMLYADQEKQQQERRRPKTNVQHTLCTLKQHHHRTDGPAKPHNELSKREQGLPRSHFAWENKEDRNNVSSGCSCRETAQGLKSSQSSGRGCSDAAAEVPKLDDFVVERPWTKQRTGVLVCFAREHLSGNAM